MAPVVRAIDVGFGNTKYVVPSPAGDLECSHFPSIAHFRFDDKAIDPLGTRRRTIAPLVDGSYYEVGPDIELAAGRFRPDHLHDGFADTPHYRALVAGALHYMKVDAVDLLVLGLPVALFLAKRAALERFAGQTLDVGRKRTTRIGRVLVLAQPQGALYAYATQLGSSAAAVAQGRSLVIDVGARTFDWLVTHRMKVMSHISRSVNRGVSDILIEIAAQIGRELKEEYSNVDAIDIALRSGKPLRIYQKSHELKRYDAIVQSVAGQAVSAMVQGMDRTDDIENIILVGGGAHLFRKAIKKAFPHHTIHEVPEPIYANVRGFQLLGEQYVRERPELFIPSEPAISPRNDLAPQA
jgi:plasmid segregation protein ParM